jgi:hypothetical protein
LVVDRKTNGYKAKSTAKKGKKSLEKPTYHPCKINLARSIKSDRKRIRPEIKEEREWFEDPYSINCSGRFKRYVYGLMTWRITYQAGTLNL